MRFWVCEERVLDDGTRNEDWALESPLMVMQDRSFYSHCFLFCILMDESIGRVFDLGS